MSGVCLLPDHVISCFIWWSGANYVSAEVTDYFLSLILEIVSVRSWFGVNDEKIINGHLSFVRGMLVFGVWVVCILPIRQ